MKDKKRVSAFDGKAEELISEILFEIGDDPNREGLRDTPSRVVRSWERLYGGYSQDPKDILKVSFESEGYDQVIVLRDVEFWSTCEHHMLPFYGRASIGYLPKKGRVVGISKLARLVEIYARRLQIQERMTHQIAAAIDTALNPDGVAVLVHAQHLCMVARGVEKQQSEMVTSAMMGVFLNEAAARQEVLRLMGEK